MSRYPKKYETPLHLITDPSLQEMLRRLGQHGTGDVNAKGVSRVEQVGRVAETIIEARTKAAHGGQGRGLKRKTSDGRAICGRCGVVYDGVTAHGPGKCARSGVQLQGRPS